MIERSRVGRQAGKHGDRRRKPKSGEDARARIMNLASGYMGAQALLTAQECGLLALLARGPRSVKSCATRLKCSPRGIRALVDALASLDLVCQDEERVKVRSDLAAFFSPDDPAYIGDMLKHQRRLYDGWGQLGASVRSGAPAKRKMPSLPERKRFLLAMVGGSQPSIREFFEIVDLSRARSFLDVGGGLGAYLIAAAERWPHLELALFDLPQAVQLARGYLRERGLDRRIRCLGGDARSDPIPGSYDAILVSNVLHMFSGRECVALLRRARRALAPGGVVLVKDFLLSADRSGPASAALFALNMLVGTEGGGVYTDEEYGALFRRAGLRVTASETLGEASVLYQLEGA